MFTKARTQVRELMWRLDYLASVEIEFRGPDTRCDLRPCNGDVALYRVLGPHARGLEARFPRDSASRDFAIRSEVVVGLRPGAASEPNRAADPILLCSWKTKAADLSAQNKSCKIVRCSSGQFRLLRNSPLRIGASFENRKTIHDYQQLRTTNSRRGIRPRRVLLRPLLPSSNRSPLC
jgi:hypothetical protein